MPTPSHVGSRPGAIVVGTGFGCRVHVPALRAAGFEVLALVGTDPDRTARRAERNRVWHAITDLDAARRDVRVVRAARRRPGGQGSTLVVRRGCGGRLAGCVGFARGRPDPYVLGEFESVSATLRVVSARAGGAENSFTVRFRLRSGVDGVLQQTAAWGPIAGSTRVAGTDGTLC